MGMQGGFARVYEVSDDNHVHHAVKVVAKVNLQSKKSKTKVGTLRLVIEQDL